MLDFKSIEIGYGFLTVWSPSYPQLKEYCKGLYPKLPLEVRKVNNKDLWQHCEPAFHPYGIGPDCGRTQFKHFHIVYPDQPTYNDVDQLKALLEAPKIKIEYLEEHVDPNINKKEALQKSQEILRRIRDVHNKKLSK